MNKYDIKLPNNEIMSLYGNDIEWVINCVKKLGYTITKKDIVIDSQLSYMSYIKEIIDNSEDIIYIQNKEYYLYKSDKGLIPIHFWKDDDFYFNGLQYIEGEYDKINKVIKPFKGEFAYTINQIWNNPEDFLIHFKSKQNKYLPMEFISKKELNKNFEGKLINRKGRYIYKDKFGYYYLYNKSDINNKEYKEFKNNKEAILVEYSYNDYNDTTQWFKNIDEFMKKWNKEYESKIPSLKNSSAYYKILKKGYEKLPPNERYVYLRLPYFDIHMYDSFNYKKEFKIHLINEYLMDKINNSSITRYENSVLQNNFYYNIVKTIWNIEQEGVD